jgi:hypothetical protein
MSTIAELFDRLSGVGPLKEKQAAIAARIERLSEYLIDHERRLIRLETAGELKRLPKPRK